MYNYIVYTSCILWSIHIKLRNKCNGGRRMNKRKIAIIITVLSWFLILLSTESITAVGVVDARCTYFQTISPFGKYFDLTIVDLQNMIIISWIFKVLFTIGLLLLYVPCFLFFFTHKMKSISLVVINTIGIIISFLLFLSYNYMLMLTTVNVLLLLHITVQYIDTIKEKFSILIFLSSTLVTFFNIFFLYQHLNQTEMFSKLDVNESYEILIKEMTSISKINMICFILWVIPILLLIMQNRTINPSQKETDQ